MSANGSVGVTDVYSHKLHILSRNANGEFENEKMISSKRGCLDAFASKAQLAEPVGLCFDLDTAIISCFGGTSTGCIKLYTNVSCACNFMSNIRQIYDATGFLPKIEQNQLMWQGKKINVPFKEGLQKLIDSLTYLQDVVGERKKYLHMATAGPEGTIYHISLEGFAEMIKSLKTHIQAFDAVGLQDTTKSLNLYAFVNESRKEHGFAKHKQTGQYRHPTKQQCIHSKGQNEVELIKKTCKCPHSYHTNTFTAYQPTHASQLSSIEVIKQYGKWNKLLGPKDTSTTTDIQKQDLKTAMMLNVLTKSRPCQNIRDLYRYKCGYGPCIIFQRDALFLDDNEEIIRHYPDFQQQMDAIQIRRGEIITAVDRRVEGNKYVFLPGDIVVVNPGVDEEIPSSDKWWLLQINKPHEASKDGSGCHVFGFWLDEQGRSDGDCRYFNLLPTPVKVYFGSIVKNGGTPVMIPASEIVSGWQDGRVSYAFTMEYCMKLDELSDIHRTVIEGFSEMDDSESDEERSDPIDNQSENVDSVSHDIALASITNKRRAVRIRNFEGETICSYKDLAGIRNNTRQRRLPNR